MACIRDYAFGMNVMEEIFEIRSCIEILANDIKIDTTDQYMLYSHLSSTLLPQICTVVHYWVDGRLLCYGILSDVAGVTPEL